MILSQMAFALGACGGAGENPDAHGREHGVEGAGELACTIPDQELGWSRALAEVHQEVTRRLRRSRAVGVGGDAGQVNAAGGVLDDDIGSVESEQHKPGVHVLVMCSCA
jgi:hypothetical protein